MNQLVVGLLVGSLISIQCQAAPYLSCQPGPLNRASGMTVEDGYGGRSGHEAMAGVIDTVRTTCTSGHLDALSNSWELDHYYEVEIHGVGVGLQFSEASAIAIKCSGEQPEGTYYGARVGFGLIAGASLAAFHGANGTCGFYSSSLELPADALVAIDTLTIKEVSKDRFDEENQYRK